MKGVVGRVVEEDGGLMEDGAKGGYFICFPGGSGRV